MLHHLPTGKPLSTSGIIVNHSGDTETGSVWFWSLLSKHCIYILNQTQALSFWPGPFLVFLYPPVFIYFPEHLLIRVVYISGDPGLASRFTQSHLMKQAHKAPFATEHRESISKPMTQMLRAREPRCEFHWKYMSDPCFIPHSWEMGKRSHPVSLVLTLQHL